jgi:divalent metal cation (Fe/Co/Zn/Cd) transporter
MSNSKNSNELNRQRRIAILLILWRLPEFVTSLIAATASGSVVVWLEFVENASVLIPGILLAVLAAKLNKNLKFVFNYGTGKVEAITALSIEIFDMAGLACLFFFAIKGIIRPETELKNLRFALFVSIIGLLIDIIIMFRQKMILDASNSKMFHTAYVSAQKEFFFDAASIIALLISIVFEQTAWIVYFSPVVCILISIPFFFIVLHHMRGSVTELIDRTLDEKTQLKILKVLNEFYEDYEELGEIKSRINGEEKHIDIELKFSDDAKYSSIKGTCSRIVSRVQEELGPSIVNIVFLP